MSQVSVSQVAGNRPAAATWFALAAVARFASIGAAEAGQRLRNREGASGRPGALDQLSTDAAGGAPGAGAEVAEAGTVVAKHGAEDGKQPGVAEKGKWRRRPTSPGHSPATATPGASNARRQR